MTNTFGVLSGMDEGEKGCEELILNVNWVVISNVNYPPVNEGHQEKNDSTIPSEGLNTGPKKVNDLVNKDSDSEEDEVLYEQWKETYEDDPYDDADFDSLGLLKDQMTYPKLDIC
ncbi:hypothetical protein Tco_0278117 [Tanacetum coccineum]